MKYRPLWERPITEPPDSSHAYPRFANLVESLEVERPDQVRVADITYVRLKMSLYIYQ
jgi:hypothetical protein